jgi:hypothetical protein
MTINYHTLFRENVQLFSGYTFEIASEYMARSKPHYSFQQVTDHEHNAQSRFLSSNE